MTTSSELLDLSPVMPVVVLDDAEAAPDVARALLAGGIRTIELTLRTPAALEAIEKVASQVPDIVVGAGTVTTPEQAAQAADAGAAFLVTPGTTDALLDAVAATRLPFLPGAATVSEAMRLAERGLDTLKFFPAEASGGPAALKAFAGPLPHLKFCPTGGVSVANAPEYLGLSNVGCVGGSWLTPKDAVAARDFATIERLAKESAALAS
ncbi:MULTISPECIES: bifunctional 4-hydroxy-2-oxoglutarate aldolase/2-dehydro-3-deoxy-phosphogluconate aldolase [Prauserella salsuginis group]|uniref:2-dehydro-3-deoxy-phosphogluconate aldolase n=2 Tax=Prauserella salsuginis group TaxID=2893672 RepID=A0A839XWD0_9PSEU|nr:MULTISPECIES: bifunctional 4-hydroxy-2-oxoglutarate aldolase/2-dehydro-3-deoxy-phosphogluconate aldolase [Prauserella salsuginis group]MBB3664095.1 2-dehydro-3-deoxyphosphogluconate aldolase/(4S)-4-hydroxy-2-oxoglutarate aldolase [Prauserella sediminis]MCR3721549.1 2-keto-3-deoxy-phosphogluconate aldolase (EC 4.1.2.14) [Prauserella flava]MCR3734241.1 2-keto-3-deoxy-phosphogluconate aldolase (EC 4.1.2.14) [Prauserella salsuginis]